MTQLNKHFDIDAQTTEIRISGKITDDFVINMNYLCSGILLNKGDAGFYINGDQLKLNRLSEPILTIDKNATYCFKLIMPYKGIAHHEITKI